MDIKKVCLVTGGAGFIGSNLTETLLKKGYKVYCLDNFITGKFRNVKHLEKYSNFKFIKFNLTERLPTKLLSQLSDIHFIYHLASPASPPKYQKYSIETLLVNSFGTHQLLNLAKYTNSYFLLASTSEIYGNPLEHPQKESYFGNVNPVGIRSCYDESKRFAETITMEYYRKYRTKIRIIRIFNTYGPRMDKNDGRVISNFIIQARLNKPLTLYGNGLQTRSFCYIDDLVRGIVLAMENKKIDGQVINLGNPEEKKIIEIGKHILKLTKKDKLKFKYIKMPQDDPERRRPDISKAKKLLSWIPNVSLDEGLTNTIKYFENI